MSVHLELTELCNQRCSYCYNYFRYCEADSEKRPLAHFAKIVDHLVEAGVFGLIVTGGEPFVCPNLALDLIRYAKAAGLVVSLNTNLTLVTSALALELAAAGISHLQTSLFSYDPGLHDGTVGLPGAQERLCTGADALRAAGVTLSANMVVTSHNAEHVLETAKFSFDKLGAVSFSATPYVPCEASDHFRGLMLSREQVVAILRDLLTIADTGSPVDVLTALPPCMFDDQEPFKWFLRRNCSAGRSNLVIGSSGEVRACIHSPEKVGNILEKSLSEIWAGLGLWSGGALTPQECIACSAASRCHGGCRVSAACFGTSRSLHPWARPERQQIVGKWLEAQRSQESHETPRGAFEQRLELPERVLARQERAGAILLYCPPEATVMLSESEWVVIRLLRDRTPAQVCEEFGLDAARLHELLRKLARTGFLRKTQRR